jgi:serine/threonine protein kinase
MRDNVGLENNEFLSLSIFTVMELIQGGTLHDLCYRVAAFNRTLPVPQPPISLDERVILKIASQIVAVLKFLTDQVVHRDIKPLNIMLCNSLSDPQLLLLCRPSTDDAAFFKLLNEISIKVIDFGHPDPNGDGCNVTGASPIS